MAWHSEPWHHLFAAAGAIPGRCGAETLFATFSTAGSRMMADVAPMHPRVGEQAPDRRSIGAMLLKAGLITLRQIEGIARYREERGIRFGEATVERGYISAEALEDLLAVQFALPGKVGRRELHRDLAVVHHSRSREAEEFRSLRNALTMKWFRQQGGARTLAIVSAQKGDGRSMVAANLAVGFAPVGRSEEQPAEI